MSRKKLTEKDRKGSLTLHINENLLDKLDKLNFKGNRSEFIEKILIEYLKDKNE